MGKVIAVAAFLIVFGIFMAIKYTARHASVGVKAAKGAINALEDGAKGALHTHFNYHVHEAESEAES